MTLVHFFCIVGVDIAVLQITVSILQRRRYAHTNFRRGDSDPPALRSYAAMNQSICLREDVARDGQSNIMTFLSELKEGNKVVIHFKGPCMSSKEGSVALVEFISLDTTGATPDTFFINCSRPVGMNKVCGCLRLKLSCVIALAHAREHFSKIIPFFAKDPEAKLFVETAKNLAP